MILILGLLYVSVHIVTYEYTHLLGRDSRSRTYLNSASYFFPAPWTSMNGELVQRYFLDALGARALA